MQRKRTKVNKRQQTSICTVLLTNNHRIGSYPFQSISASGHLKKMKVTYFIHLTPVGLFVVQSFIVKYTLNLKNTLIFYTNIVKQNLRKHKMFQIREGFV